MTRYSYHTGLRSHQAATDALTDALACAEISVGERPQVETYYITRRDDGRHVQRWQITLEF